LDPATKIVQKEEVTVALTAKEYAVLHTLMQHPSRTFTREELEDKLYAAGNEVDSNAVAVHIHHRRKKLGNTFIRTRLGLRASELVDPATKSVQEEEVTVAVTAKEYAVLHTLMQHTSRTFTREELEDKLYAWGNEVESNAVEVHIHHLRKKLGNTFIRTRRGL